MCSAGPDVRTDLGGRHAELLVELAPQRRLVVLTGLLAAAWGRPHGDLGELEAHEEDAVGGIEHEGPHGGPDAQTVDVHRPIGYSTGLSGRSPLKARYIS